ncbi:ribonuclease P protein component [Patescibacteria group bacterium]|nr:ribonuclease P protein component [Patescibacteria group bacterium]MBU1074960.1 ribonuclease P protein component [Patescibacteria group bacterium]MBU1951443.1 ribonuclease P protein component [Patescibacteria group bacterium]MBU2229199.1 ribonuclease P protein component [Patescibacteria group bacterium]
MLPKKHRLTKEGDFKRVYEKRNSVFLPSLSLRYLRKDKKEESRFGFVVSGKIYKKSVERNLLKRRMRVIIKKQLPQILSGYDYIVSARPGIKNKSYQEIEKEIEKLFEKPHLYAKRQK